MQRRGSILVLNGPNLNLLGSRETKYYGKHNYAKLQDLCQQTAHNLGYEALCIQSNVEGELINQLHAFGEQYQAGIGIGAICNLGAYTHTSIALHDAIKALVPMPVIECHISNIHARESFRHQSYIASVSVGQIIGFGIQGYVMAIQALVRTHEKYIQKDKTIRQ